MTTKKPGIVVFGLALFSMFFGSGNLIYPLMLGRDAGSSFLISSAGFVLTAVLIPTFGVVAIAFAEGSYERIFSSLFSPRVSRALIFVILLSFIPFGAGPRCVVLAHASLKTFVAMPPLWLFSALFLALVGYLVSDRSRLLDVLGKLLTPLLLLSITIMVVSAFIHGEIDPPLASDWDLFTNALLQGYNTQDLMSSLFFSSSLILLTKPAFSTKKDLILTILKGATLSISLLAILYVFLIAGASLHNDILIGKSGIELVSILAKHTLGQHFGLVAGIAVALACLTTAVALIMSFSEFIAAHFLTKRDRRISLAISLISVFLTSLLEFEGITAIITPMMKLLYPVILMVVFCYLHQLYKKRPTQ